MRLRQYKDERERERKSSPAFSERARARYIRFSKAATTEASDPLWEIAPCCLPVSRVVVSRVVYRYRLCVCVYGCKEKEFDIHILTWHARMQARIGKEVLCVWEKELLMFYNGGFYCIFDMRFNLINI